MVLSSMVMTLPATIVAINRWLSYGPTGDRGDDVIKNQAIKHNNRQEPAH